MPDPKCLIVPTAEGPGFSQQACGDQLPGLVGTTRVQATPLNFCDLLGQHGCMDVLSFASPLCKLVISCLPEAAACLATTRSTPL